MDYKVDYEHYTTEEVIRLIEFLSNVEKYHTDKTLINPETLVDQYKDFKRIINNVSEEKTIDKAFEKQTNISIFQTMKSLKGAK